VPTDPFVSPDPDARPRQQQNLPPGVALPPAEAWTPDRPGDLGPHQPEGELLGNPGPNVGYAYNLVERVKDELSLAPHEHASDAAAVVAEVAGKRAASYGRAPVMPDIKRAMAILGYDGSASDDFARTRTLAVQEAAHEYPKRRKVVDAVPEALLRDTNADVSEWRREFASVHAH
jgi:hypothetical protein